MPLTACPKNNWLILSESESSRQEDVYEIEMSYEIPILIFVAILCLIIVSSCLSKCFHRINIKTPQLTAWAPIWARRKSSVFQASTNMRTWDLERNDMHPSDAKPSNPYDSVLQQLKTSFRMEAGSPRSPQNTS